MGFEGRTCPTSVLLGSSDFNCGVSYGVTFEIYAGGSLMIVFRAVPASNPLPKEVPHDVNMDDNASIHL